MSSSLGDYEVMMDEWPPLDTAGAQTHTHAHTHAFVTNSVFQYKHLISEAITYKHTTFF